VAQSLGDGHRSLVTLEKVLSEYNEDLIFLFPHQLQAFCLKFIGSVAERVKVSFLRQPSDNDRVI